MAWTTSTRSPFARQPRLQPAATWPTKSRKPRLGKFGVNSVEQVDPGVLFQVDEALGFPGTEGDPTRRATADATHDAVQDAIVAAHDRAALIDTVTRAVLADPRVREAISNVTKVASEVAASEIRRLQTRVDRGTGLVP